ncbi:hypothetical protein E2320_000891 [Naja naja]|nr:hypothetical protein E2320_000891 [Naja naja]
MPRRRCERLPRVPFGAPPPGRSPPTPPVEAAAAATFPGKSQPRERPGGDRQPGDQSDGSESQATERAMMEPFPHGSSRNLLLAACVVPWRRPSQPRKRPL